MASIYSIILNIKLQVRLLDHLLKLTKNWLKESLNVHRIYLKKR